LASAILALVGTQARIALPPWTERLIRELDDSDRRAKELAGRLSVEQLNWQPAPGSWSVGQCLEHLSISNEVYLPSISAALAENHVAVVAEITPGWFARWFIRSYIEPSSQTKRAPAPRKIAPGSKVESSVLDRFLSTNQSARELIRRAAAYDPNRIRFKNPFIPGLRFTVGTGFEIICGHERRHLLQGERVRQSTKFPGAEA